MNKTKQNKFEDETSHVGEAASQLLNEGKKLANELYEENAQKITDIQENIQENIKEYSEDLTQKIKDNPLNTLLIAGGIGFLLSVLLRK